MSIHANSDLVCSIKDGVGIITLNRPAVHNAISLCMWQAIPESLLVLEQSGARVIVFRGEGKSFAAGADLAELIALKTYEEAQEQWLAIRNCLNYLSSNSIPTIASIEGACIGGGCLLALACDLRIAAQGSTFGIPVSKLGILLDEANLTRLTCLVGPALAKELIFLGATISGARAEAIGLINKLVESAELEKTVDAYAKAIMANSLDAIKRAKADINGIWQNKHLEQDQKDMIESYLSQDFRDRIAALS